MNFYSKTFLGLILFFIIGSGTTSAQTLPFEPVHITSKFEADDNLGKNIVRQGNGARFKSPDGCITVTPAHVVRGSAIQIISPLKAGTDLTEVFRQNSTLDLAIVRERLTSANNCPVFPKNRNIEIAIRSAVNREIWFVEFSGESAKVISVAPLSVSRDYLELKLSSREIMAGTKLQQGMSGSVVVFDGVPVAIVQSVNVDTNAVTALRLNTIRHHYPETGIDDVSFSQFTQSTTKKEAVRTIVRDRKPGPYDISQLPRAIQKKVKEARKNRNKSENTAVQAASTKELSSQAAQEARKYARNEYHNGLGRFKASNGNDYAGEVILENKTISSDGYGISIVGNYDYFGNTYYCRFTKNIGCNGPGVLKYGPHENAGSKEAWYGGFKDGKRSGFGHLTWSCIEDAGAKQAWIHSITDQSISGIWETCDGRLFEGEISNKWHGQGVLWNADGTVRIIGKWQDGKLIERYNWEWNNFASIDWSENGQLYRQAVLTDIEETSHKTLKRLCKINHYPSCVRLGFILSGHYSYINLEADYPAAAKAWEISCTGGFKYGCDQLGLLYWEGNGVQQDRDKAFSLEILACQRDDFDGCEIAADWMINEGYMPVDKDVVADNLLIKACEGGKDSACEKANIIIEYTK